MRRRLLLLACCAAAVALCAAGGAACATADPFSSLSSQAETEYVLTGVFKTRAGCPPSCSAATCRHGCVTCDDGTVAGLSVFSCNVPDVQSGDLLTVFGTAVLDSSGVASFVLCGDERAPEVEPRNSTVLPPPPPRAGRDEGASTRQCSTAPKWPQPTPQAAHGDSPDAGPRGGVTGAFAGAATCSASGCGARECASGCLVCYDGSLVGLSFTACGAGVVPHGADGALCEWKGRLSHGRRSESSSRVMARPRCRRPPARSFRRVAAGRREACLLRRRLAARLWLRR